MKNLIKNNNNNKKQKNFWPKYDTHSLLIRQSLDI